MGFESGDDNLGNSAGWGSALGNILGGLGGFFTSNPSDAAMPYLNNISPMLQQYLSPYIQQGQSGFNTLNNYMNMGNNASNALMGQYSNLINNPSGVMNRIGSSFQQSPGYGWQVNQALNAANRAAAAGGMAGSPAEQQQASTVASQLANQDYYNYLNHGMSLYGQGLSGLQGMSGMGLSAGQNIYGIGANAANNLASSLGSLAMSQGNLAYAGQINQNQSDMGGFGALGEGIGEIASLVGLL
jgi:hypothetical protein